MPSSCRYTSGPRQAKRKHNTVLQCQEWASLQHVYKGWFPSSQYLQHQFPPCTKLVGSDYQSKPSQEHVTPKCTGPRHISILITTTLSNVEQLQPPSRNGIIDQTHALIFLHLWSKFNRQHTFQHWIHEASSLLLIPIIPKTLLESIHFGGFRASGSWKAQQTFNFQNWLMIW